MKSAIRQEGIPNNALCKETYIKVNRMTKERILDSIDVNVREAVKEVETIVPYARLDRGR